jgi:hypothetical protein
MVERSFVRLLASRGLEFLHLGEPVRHVGSMRLPVIYDVDQAHAALSALGVEERLGRDHAGLPVAGLARRIDPPCPAAAGRFARAARGRGRRNVEMSTSRTPFGG